MSGQGVATDARADAGAAIRGLYAITPELEDSVELTRLVAAALRGGAAVVQYRAKRAGGELRREQARALNVLCAQFGVPLIINDDWRLALGWAPPACTSAPTMAIRRRCARRSGRE